jgi:hypothetical protein
MMNIFMTCQMKNLALHVDEKSCGSITVFFNQRLEDLDQFRYFCVEIFKINVAPLDRDYHH